MNARGAALAVMGCVGNKIRTRAKFDGVRIGGDGVGNRQCSETAAGKEISAAIANRVDVSLVAGGSSVHDEIVNCVAMAEIKIHSIGDIIIEFCIENPLAHAPSRGSGNVHRR